MDLGKVERSIHRWSLGHVALASELASWPWSPCVRQATGRPQWSPDTRAVGGHTPGLASGPRTYQAA